MREYVTCPNCGREVLQPDSWMSIFPWRAQDACSCRYLDKNVSSNELDDQREESE